MTARIIWNVLQVLCVGVSMSCTWKLSREQHLKHLFPEIIYLEYFQRKKEILITHLRVEKQAPDKFVSRWFFRVGSIEVVSLLNIGFGFMLS